MRVLEVLVIYIYIYITETSKTFTIFHVRTILLLLFMCVFVVYKVFPS